MSHTCRCCNDFSSLLVASFLLCHFCSGETAIAELAVLADGLHLKILDLYTEAQLLVRYLHQRATWRQLPRGQKLWQVHLTLAISVSFFVYIRFVHT